MKVLVVCDQLIVMDRLRSMMDDMQGVSGVDEAVTAGQVMQMLEQTLPGLVLLDMHVQSGKGMEILAVIKEKYPTVKIVVLVNYDFPQYKKKCMAMGVEHILDKSKGMADLKKIISNLSLVHSASVA